jgi:hypothetical protein
MSRLSRIQKTFPGSTVFDEQNLLSVAGLVPVLELAEQTGLSRVER